ncbi:hypothetical protein BC940DRAFT_316593 [Gongronella butleri]|nr:hypothetical protein BC940DRAFT_316593 [Gongronella butleri]
MDSRPLDGPIVVDVDTVPEREMVFIVRDEDQARELAPLICHEQTSKTVLVLAAGLPMSALEAQLLQHDNKCTLTTPDRSVHELNWPAAALPSWQQSIHCVATLHPAIAASRASVLVHALPTNDPMAHCLPENDITVIHMPARDVPRATWLMDLPIESIQRWHDAKIQLILTTDRNPYGLTRLLRSASRAHYLGDKIDLTILMDQSSDRVTVQFANTVAWEHGTKHVRHRIVKMNKMPLFVEAWYPQNDYDDYAILLHDDIDLSDQFYVWAKQALLRYRYAPPQASSYSSSMLAQSIMGVSLYSPQLLDTPQQGRQPFAPPPGTTHPYLMQVVTNGGTLFFPEHWREFHHYVTARFADIHKKQLQSITVPDARSGNWTNSWRRYLDELMYLRGYSVLYPLVQGGKASMSSLYLDLQLDHLLHAHDDQQQQQQVANDDDAGMPPPPPPLPIDQDDLAAIKALFQVPLANYVPPLAPSLNTVSLLDLWGKPIEFDAILERGRAFQSTVSACPPHDAYLYDPSDLLCPFARIVELPVQDATADILPTRVATLFVPKPTEQ